MIASPRGFGLLRHSQTKWLLAFGALGAVSPCVACSGLLGIDPGVPETDGGLTDATAAEGNTADSPDDIVEAAAPGEADAADAASIDAAASPWVPVSGSTSYVGSGWMLGDEAVNSNYPVYKFNIPTKTWVVQSGPQGIQITIDHGSYPWIAGTDSVMLHTNALGLADFIPMPGDPLPHIGTFAVGEPNFPYGVWVADGNTYYFNTGTDVDASWNSGTTPYGMKKIAVFQDPEPCTAPDGGAAIDMYVPWVLDVDGQLHKYVVPSGQSCEDGTWTSMPGPGGAILDITTQYVLVSGNVVAKWDDGAGWFPVLPPSLADGTSLVGIGYGHDGLFARVSDDSIQWLEDTDEYSP